jgi:hypothetical protein
MLPAFMRSRPASALCLLLAALALVAAGCGEEEEEELDVPEGEPLELGELSYNVQLTRFLNPDDAEDTEYLADQEEAPPQNAYLGVFMVIENESEDEDLPAATEFTIIDTTDQQFEPVPSESPYALDPGAPVPAAGELPLDDTTAATGPTHGSMLLFLLPDSVTENRPLELEIAGADETGHVELDI